MTFDNMLLNEVNKELKSASIHPIYLDTEGKKNNLRTRFVAGFLVVPL